MFATSQHPALFFQFKDAGPSLGSSSSSAFARFYCQTCPYVQPITARTEKRLPLARKKVDDVLGGEGAWKNVDTTDVKCPSCANGQAYFMQIQIRSADEPMTTFYRCTACRRNWSSN